MIYIFQLDRVGQPQTNLEVTVWHGGDVCEAVSHYAPLLYTLVREDGSGSLICIQSNESKDSIIITGTLKSYKLDIYTEDGPIKHYPVKANRVSMTDSVVNIIHRGIKREIENKTIATRFHFSLENSAGIISFDRHQPVESRISEYAYIDKVIREHMPDVARIYTLRRLASTEQQCVYLIQDEYDAMKVFGTCVVTHE